MFMFVCEQKDTADIEKELSEEASDDSSDSMSDTRCTENNTSNSKDGCRGRWKRRGSMFFYYTLHLWLDKQIALP